MKKGTRKPDFGYDFWYQPFFNVMISTEYGAPKFFMENLNLEHVSGGGYGTHLNVFDWRERTLSQRIDLGAEGVMPLEIRFLHDPKKAEVNRDTKAGKVKKGCENSLFPPMKTCNDGRWKSRNQGS